MTAFDDLDDHLTRLDLADAAARLQRLRVSELRLLHVHYFQRRKLALELSKQHLIEELADMLVEDGR